MTTVETAMDRRQDAAASGNVTIVAVDAPLRSDSYWMSQMLAIWTPNAVWVVVEATRKPEDLEPWLDGLPRVDALVVTDTDLSADPAAVLRRVAAPVAIVDGVRATPTAGPRCSVSVWRARRHESAALGRAPRRIRARRCPSSPSGCGVTSPSEEVTTRLLWCLAAGGEPWPCCVWPAPRRRWPGRSRAAWPPRWSPRPRTASRPPLPDPAGAARSPGCVVPDRWRLCSASRQR